MRAGPVSIAKLRQRGKATVRGPELFVYHPSTHQLRRRLISRKAAAVVIVCLVLLTGAAVARQCIFLPDVRPAAANVAVRPNQFSLLAAIIRFNSGLARWSSQRSEFFTV